MINQTVTLFLEDKTFGLATQQVNRIIIFTCADVIPLHPKLLCCKYQRKLEGMIDNFMLS